MIQSFLVLPPIYSVSLTFPGCPLQLYLLRMFCSSAHRKISFKTFFFEMFLNKCLIKCENFVSCLMQYSKKYWKWPETYLLILQSYWTPQFQSFTFPSRWLSSHSISQRYYYPCITFLLHNFKLFTNLLIGIFGVSNTTFYWVFWETMCQL